MKKIIALILVMVLCVVLGGCESKEPQQESSNINSETTNNTSSDKTETSEVDVSTEKYTKKASIPLKNVYVNGHEDMMMKKVTFARMFLQDNKSLTALAYDDTNEFNGSLEDVVGFLNDVFLKDINNNCEATVEGCKISIDESEKTTINGFESIKFKGYIPSEEYKLHIYGYSFIINDVPCMVVGLVSDTNQNPELISSVNNHVDNMVKTIRTES